MISLLLDDDPAQLANLNQVWKPFVNLNLLSKACLVASSACLVSACSGQESLNSTKGSQEDLAVAAASKALTLKGHKGFKPTGEIHKVDNSEGASAYEIVFSDGSKTFEVDVLSDSYTAYEIEEDIELNAIPQDVQAAAAATGEDIQACGHYQKAVKLDSGDEVWFEFEECNNGKIDIEVKQDGLQVVTDENDQTSRDMS